jgi:hypothetical protein
MEAGLTESVQSRSLVHQCRSAIRGLKSPVGCGTIPRPQQRLTPGTQELELQ